VRSIAAAQEKLEIALRCFAHRINMLHIIIRAAHAQAGQSRPWCSCNETLTEVKPCSSISIARRQARSDNRGCTGLGKGIAKHLAEHGSEVHLWGRRRKS